jgi:hypothetical protein
MITPLRDSTSSRRLTNNNMLDPNTELENSERWSGHATLLILAGIVLELIALYVFTKEMSWIEKAVISTANIVIGIGLVIEYRCIGRAKIATAELQRLSDEKVAAAEALGAEANQRAAEANLALERFRAPRVLSDEQIDRIAKELRQFAGVQFDIGISSRDPELLRLVALLERALEQAEWTEIDFRGSDGISAVRTRSGAPSIGTSVSAIGVIVGLSRPEKEIPVVAKAARALANALEAEGIETMYTWVIPGLLDDNGQVFTALGPDGETWRVPAIPSSNENAVHIRIGRKT